jgi:hypothetical protein
MSKATNPNTIVGKAIINVLLDRKGFDWWFEELEGPLRREIILAVGKAAIKAFNDYQNS